MSLMVFLSLSVLMAISVGFLVSLLLRSWLSKPRQKDAPAEAASPPRTSLEDKAADPKDGL
jgi:hypothetical protein